MPTETIQATTEFFLDEKGVGAESPCSLPQSSIDSSSFILNHTVNLDGSIALPFYHTTPCEPKYIVLQCNCRRTIVPSTCMRLDCPSCSPYIRLKRSTTVFRRLINPVPGRRLRYNRKTVIYTVFTVPFELRANFVDPKAWQKVRKKAWRVLKKHFGGVYGVEVSHPSGDKDESIFHPHLNFLWIQRPGWKPFLNVDELRGFWQSILDVNVADVHTEYSSDMRKIKHWTNYVCRTFPGTHKWTGPVRWYGTYPKIKRDVETLCADCGCKYHSIGWIEKYKVDDYFKNGFMIGIDPPWERDNEIRSWK